MEELNGATIFWLIALGMIIGATAKVVMGNKGMSMSSNLIGGILGTLIVGSIGIEMQLPGSLLFAVLGSLSILFLGNVFFVQPEMEDH